MKNFTLFLLANLCALYVHSQALGDYRSNGAVNFTTITNWQVLTALPSTWSAATVAPASSLTLGNTNTISVLAAHTVTYNSNFNFASNTNFTINIVGPIASAGSFNVGYGNGLSTVRIERSANYAATNIFQNHTFRNLLLVGTGGTRAFSFTANLTITNALNIVSGSLSLPGFNLTDVNLSINSAGNITVTGNQTLTRSNITANLSGSGRTLTFQGTLSMSGTPGSSISANFSGTAGVFLVTGNISLNNSTLGATFANSSSNQGLLRFDGTVGLSNGSAINMTGDYADLENNSNTTNLSASTINLLSDNQEIKIPGGHTLSFSNTSAIKLQGANGLLNFAGSVNINGANGTNYIQLSSSSYVQKQINVNNSFSFPIGTASNFLPVTVNALTGGGNPNFRVGVFQGATTDAQASGPSAYKPPIVDAIWDIQQNGNNPKDVTLSFGWQNGLEGSLFSSLANNQLGVGSFNTATSSWNAAVAGTGVNGSTNTFLTGTFSLAGTNTRNPFAIGQIGVILPLLSRNFTAAPYNGQVILNWIGVATHSSAYFEVERSSSENGQFAKIATLPVSVVGEANYEFVDVQPIKPTSHYRIKIIDERKKISYTKTLKVIIGGTHFALDNLYPTLTRGPLNLLISNSRQKQVRMTIIDQQGRTVKSESLSVNAGSQVYRLDVTNLAGGQYFLVLNNGEETINSRFIKQ